MDRDSNPAAAGLAVSTASAAAAVAAVAGTASALVQRRVRRLQRSGPMGRTPRQSPVVKVSFVMSCARSFPPPLLRGSAW